MPLSTMYAYIYWVYTFKTAIFTLVFTAQVCTFFVFVFIKVNKQSLYPLIRKMGKSVYLHS